jgi:hypothetical protein
VRSKPRCSEYSLQVASTAGVESDQISFGGKRHVPRSVPSMSNSSPLVVIPSVATGIFIELVE